MNCTGRIDLSRPIGSERRRGYQPPWYTVFLYTCPVCSHKVWVKAGAFRGKNPVPGTGAIICSARVSAVVPSNADPTTKPTILPEWTASRLVLTGAWMYAETADHMEAAS